MNEGLGNIEEKTKLVTETIAVENKELTSQWILAGYERRFGLVYMFFRGFFEGASAMLGMRAGVAFHAPALPGTIYATACELTVAARASWLREFEVSKNEREALEQITYGRDIVAKFLEFLDAD